MREIKCRGKCRGKDRIDFSFWAYGCALPKPWPNGCYIVVQRGDGIMWVEVDPKTVGQYAGMTDTKGRPIYEGDIVRRPNGQICQVVWNFTGFYLRYDPPHEHGFNYELTPLCNFWNAHGPIIEIIGNIHDNPELLKGGGADA